jgi:hypothetical protein
MAVPFYRAKQTSTTTGTGTLTLLAAATNMRSFNAAAGSSSIVVEYMIQGASYFENGIGTYNGGSPGTLTRDIIIASSNSGNAVSLAAGTHDVFLIALAGHRGLRTSTGSDTLTAAAVGERYVWTGSSAGTLTLPAIAGVPVQKDWPIINLGSAVLTIDGNSSETINGYTTITLLPGQSVWLEKRGSGWDAWGYSDKRGRYANVTGTGSDTMTIHTVGARYVWTGGTAQTYTLLPVAGVPIGVETEIVNRGTAILTVDGDSAETINGLASLPLYPGQSVRVVVRGSAWDALGYSGRAPIFKAGSGTMSSGVLAVSFATAFPNAVVGVRASQLGASGAGTFQAFAFSNPTTSGFTIYTDSGYSSGVSWEAEGY